MKKYKKMLFVVSIAFSAICLIMLLIDFIDPDLSVFLQPAVKLFILFYCVAVIAASGVMLGKTRRRLRRKQNNERIS